ncbi:MAG: hypothetical protein AAB944_00695 [Patescibacteria group bacterium]
MKKRYILYLLIIFLLLINITNKNPDKNSNRITNTANRYYNWEDMQPKLLIRYGQEIKDMVWNDPSVMKEGQIYKMWMSGGTIENMGDKVNVYYATSDDGLNWDIYPRPLISRGEKGAFDEKGIETPSVVKVNGVYHMYYTGSNYTDSHMGRFSIGHASSKDGINWTKDPNNPVIPRTFNGLGPEEGKPNAWGWLSTAEPGVVYDPVTKKIYVYFVASKLRYDDYSGAEPKIQMGIMAATSDDGSHFVRHSEPLLVQSSSYPHSEKYYGYSTPSAYIDSEGKFHLFYDAARYMSAQEQFVQVALVHAVSDDGIHFTERDVDIVRNKQGGWMDVEVRAPVAIENENNELLLYFAGGWKEGGIGVIKGIKK